MENKDGIIFLEEVKEKLNSRIEELKRKFGRRRKRHCQYAGVLLGKLYGDG